MSPCNGSCPEVSAKTKNVLKGIGFLALGAGVGATVMYLMDPNRGRARRAMLRDKSVRLIHDEEKRLGKAWADVTNRVKGAEAEFMHLFQKDDASDEKIAGRVRTKLGRSIESPHDVQVMVHGGEVVLRGKVSAKEMEKIEAAVKAVRGVKSLVNQMAGADVPLKPPLATVAPDAAAAHA